jgi:hypothetical protein
MYDQPLLALTHSLSLAYHYLGITSQNWNLFGTKIIRSNVQQDEVVLHLPRHPRQYSFYPTYSANRTRSALLYYCLTHISRLVHLLGHTQWVPPLCSSYRFLFSSFFLSDLAP